MAGTLTNLTKVLCQKSAFKIFFKSIQAFGCYHGHTQIDFFLLSKRISLALLAHPTKFIILAQVIALQKSVNHDLLTFIINNKDLFHLIYLGQILLRQCTHCVTAGAQQFSRKHPLSCWLSTMLVVFAGGMLCNGLLGEPILAPLKNTQQLMVATVVWYVSNAARSNPLHERV